MEFEKVIKGLMTYIEREMVPGMNGWQTIAAGVAMNRIARRSEHLKQWMHETPILKVMGIINDEGVDINGLAEDLKIQIERKGKLTLEIPMMGKYTFYAADIDKLRNTIMEA